MNILDSLDEIALIVFVICFFTYFILFYYSFKRSKPNKFQLYKKIYENWVESRLKDNNALVGVQALRNFIMANSTFVSALFILLGILVSVYNTFISNEKAPLFKCGYNGSITFYVKDKEILEDNAEFNLNNSCRHIVFMHKGELYSFKISEKGFVFLNNIFKTIPEDKRF